MELQPDNTFFTSDNHFWHKNIMKHCPHRGKMWASPEEMNEGMKKLWNDFVPEDATVFMLGDVFFGYKYKEAIKFMEGLHGKKILIYGNHDQTIRKNELSFQRRPWNVDGRWETRGVFESFHEYKEINVGKQNIVLFHYSPRVWNRAHHGAWCLWGHSHGSLEPFGKSVDVGVDSPWITGTPEMRPFSFSEVKKFMDKQ